MLAALPHSPHRALFEKTRGVVFFATPHRGSDLATVINRLPGVTVSPRSLLPNARELLDLNASFNQQAIPTLSCSPLAGLRAC